MSDTDACELLSEIMEWTREIPDGLAELTGVRSAAVTVDGVRAARPHELPFGLDEHTDDLTRGAQGVRTAGGVHEVMEMLARRVEKACGDPFAFGPTSYLRQHAGWAAVHMAEWPEILEEIHSVHRVVARLTGHVGQRGGQCPACGRVLSHEMGPRGLTGRSRCPSCGTTYATAEDLERDLRAAVQSLPALQEDMLVAWADLQLIYPVGLTRARFDKWVQRKRLMPAGRNSQGHNLYRLGDVDELMRQPA